MIIPIAAEEPVSDYNVKMNFNVADTYNSYLVKSYGLAPAGDSTKMGYKGYIKSGVRGSAVFKFEAAEDKTFEKITISYKGFSIPTGTDDGVWVYVSTVGETTYNDGANLAAANFTR